MTIHRRFTVLLLALSFLCTGLVMQTNSIAADAKKPPKDKKDKKPPKDLKVDGELTDNDAKDTKRTEMYCKTYTFNMVKGAKYEITMRSNGMDSYLRLENPKGDQVAEDDDGGGQDGDALNQLDAK